MSTPTEELVIRDRIDPARTAALHATMGLPGAAPDAGDPLPPFWHWIQFWDITPPGALGRDGHPRTGGFIPDTGLPRRMWAGGRLDWHGVLEIGGMAERRSKVLSVTRKTGRSGPLAFVTVRHELHGPSGLVLSEEQDLVYREDPVPGAPAAPGTAPAAPTDETRSRQHDFDVTALFRYSALTFNGHRIHYDADYCRTVEGYPAQVVHGPLIAQTLIDLAADMLPRLRRFSFRAVSPVFLGEGYAACARPAGGAADARSAGAPAGVAETPGLALWARGADGRLVMTAEAG